MGAYDDGRAACSKLGDHIPEAAASQWIDAGCGLVQEEHLRLVQHGASQGQALLPAQRESARVQVGRGHETGLFQPGPPVRQVRPGHTVQTGEESNVLLDRQVPVEGEALGHVSDPFPDSGSLGADVEPGDSAFPGRRFQESREHLDGRGLAGAIRTEEAEHLSGGDVECHRVHGDEVSEAASKSVDRYDR